MDQQDCCCCCCTLDVSFQLPRTVAQLHLVRAASLYLSTTLTLASLKTWKKEKKRWFSSSPAEIQTMLCPEPAVWFEGWLKLHQRITAVISFPFFSRHYHQKSTSFWWQQWINKTVLPSIQLLLNTLNLMSHVYELPSLQNPAISSSRANCPVFNLLFHHR